MLLWVHKIAGGQACTETLQPTVAKQTLRQVMHAQL